MGRYRMGIATRLRKIFMDMSPTPPPVKTPKWATSAVPGSEGEEAIWRKVADGDIPVVFSAQRADDIEHLYPSH